MCLEMGGRKPTVSISICAMTILSLVIVSCTDGEINTQSEDRLTIRDITATIPAPEDTQSPTVQLAEQPTEPSTGPLTEPPTAKPTPIESTYLNPILGGVLTVASVADIPHRDIHQESQYALASLGPGISYSRLMKVETGADIEKRSLTIVCDLCKTWTMKDDFSYEFQIRDDVYWHPSRDMRKRRLSSADLEYSYNRIMTEGWAKSSLYQDKGIEQFTSPSEYILNVKTRFLDNDALLSLADASSKIVAHEIVDKYGDLKTSPVVGTGPWLWDSTSSGVGSEFTANPDYFDPDIPYLDHLVIKSLPTNDSTESGWQKHAAALESGLVDMIMMNALEMNQWNPNLESYKVYQSNNATNKIALGINVQSEPLNNLTVRTAILKALDPWEYTDILWNGTGSSDLGIPIYSPNRKISENDIRTEYFANPGKARALVRSLPDDVQLDISLTVAEFDDEHIQLALRIAEDLTSVGFNVQTQAIHPSQYWEQLLSPLKTYELILGSLPPVQTTNSFLTGVLHSRGMINISDHRDGTLDLMIEEQISELNEEIRIQRLSDIQEHILENRYMFTPINSPSYWIYSDTIENFYPTNAIDEYSHWSHVWIDN